MNEKNKILWKRFSEEMPDYRDKNLPHAFLVGSPHKIHAFIVNDYYDLDKWNELVTDKIIIKYKYTHWADIESLPYPSQEYCSCLDQCCKYHGID